jgi:CheY-like chemotaxis protein
MAGGGGKRTCSTTGGIPLDPGRQIHLWHIRTSLWQAAARPVGEDTLPSRTKCPAWMRASRNRAGNALTSKKSFAMFPARQTIVVVDDDLDTGVALTRALAVFGYHTELFLSAAECLDAIATRVTDCFVIDIHLGEESGIDLSKKLTALGIKSPVIHMSGGASDTIRQESLATGSAAFLDKPFAVPELVRIIERVMAAHPVNVSIAAKLVLKPSY